MKNKITFIGIILITLLLAAAFLVTQFKNTQEYIQNLGVAASYLPDPPLTPGTLNPGVTQANIKETICVPGWTKTIRPPVSYTNLLKKNLLETRVLNILLQESSGSFAPAGTSTNLINPYYYRVAALPLAELDHFIPLSLGGAPSDFRNLWPQPYAGEHGAHQKDALELYLHSAVCKGEMTLQEAQEAIRNNWTRAYQRYFGKSLGAEATMVHDEDDEGDN